MKFNKKSLLIALTVMMMTSIFATTAAASTLSLPAPASLSEDQIISPQAEQTEWVLRYNNGVLQKRLWSNTYAKWLTDWIDVT